MKLLELSEKNLLENPLWLYKGEKDSEALIEPITVRPINDKVYIAKTEFLLNDGTRLFGYCSPEEDSGIDYTQPTIIYNNKHINLFELTLNNKDYKKLLSKIFNKNIGDILPIEIKCFIKEYLINYYAQFK